MIQKKAWDWFDPFNWWNNSNTEQYDKHSEKLQKAYAQLDTQAKANNWSDAQYQRQVQNRIFGEGGAGKQLAQAASDIKKQVQTDNSRLMDTNKRLSYAQQLVDGFNPIGAFVDYGITPEQKAAMYARYGVDPSWAMAMNMIGTVAGMTTTGLIGKGALGAARWLGNSKYIKPAVQYAAKWAGKIPGVSKLHNAYNAVANGMQRVNNVYNNISSKIIHSSKAGTATRWGLRAADNTIRHAAPHVLPQLGAYATDKTLTLAASNFDPDSWQHKVLAGTADTFNKAVGGFRVYGKPKFDPYLYMNIAASPAQQRAMYNDLMRNGARNEQYNQHRKYYDVAYKHNAAIRDIRKLKAQTNQDPTRLADSDIPIVKQFIRGYAQTTEQDLDALKDKLRTDKNFAANFYQNMVRSLEENTTSSAREDSMAAARNQADLQNSRFMMQYGRQNPTWLHTLAGITTQGIMGNIYGVKAPGVWNKLLRRYDTGVNFANMFTPWIGSALPALQGDPKYNTQKQQRQNRQWTAWTTNAPQALDLSDNIQDLITIGRSKSLAALDRADIYAAQSSPRINSQYSTSAMLDSIQRGKQQLQQLKAELPKATGAQRARIERQIKNIQRGIYASAKNVQIRDTINKLYPWRPYTYTPEAKSGQLAGIVNQMQNSAYAGNMPTDVTNPYDYRERLVRQLYNTAESPAQAVSALLNSQDVRAIGNTSRSNSGEQISTNQQYINRLMLHLLDDKNMSPRAKVQQLQQMQAQALKLLRSDDTSIYAKQRAYELLQVLKNTVYALQEQLR